MIRKLPTIYFVLTSSLFYAPIVLATGQVDNVIKPSETLSTDCTEEDKPKVTQELSDIDLQINETKIIAASDVIKGTKMYYTISALVTNPKNQIIVNRRKGIVVIKATAEDEFPVMVSASNPCGSTSVTFNVKINPAK